MVCFHGNWNNITAVLFIPVIIFVLVKFFGLKFQFDKTSATIN